MLVLGLLVPLCGATIINGTAQCVGSHCAADFFYFSPDLSVTALTPNSGPIEGTTEVVIHGSGIRDFGDLMKCRFGNTLVPARLRTNFGDSFNPYNGDQLVCQAPPSNPGVVFVEITLTGETFTSNQINFTYYENPAINFLTTISGTNNGEELTVIGSGFDKRALGIDINLLCRFTTPVLTTGNGQLVLDTTSEATLHSDTELTCDTPVTSVHGLVLVQISINGQDFTPIDPDISFRYSDNWRIGQASGTFPPHREFQATSLVGCTNFFGGDFKGCRMVIFGGWSGNFLDDVHALNFDVMNDFYPSNASKDWLWVEYTKSLDLGTRPTARGKHTATAAGTTIYIYAGLSDYNQDSLHDMYTIDENFKMKLIAPDLTQGISPPLRADHTMNFVTINGQEFLMLYGGKSMVSVPGYEGDAAIGYKTRFRFFYSRDIFTFNIAHRSWSLYSAGTDHDSIFYGRGGHSSVLLNGSSLVIFGGDCLIEDFPIDGYFGANIKSNDLISFNIQSKTFRTINVHGALRPENRTMHTAILMDSRHMIIFGGLTSSGPLNDVWAIDLISSTPTWRLLSLAGTPPTARYSMSAVLLPNNEIVMWGGTGLGSFSQELFVLNLDDQLV